MVEMGRNAQGLTGDVGHWGTRRPWLEGAGTGGLAGQASVAAGGREVNDEDDV